MQEHILLVELFCRCVFSDLCSVKHGGIRFEVWINILQHVDWKNKTAFSKFDEAAYIQSSVYWGYTTYCTSPVMNPNFICHQHSFIYYLWRELCSCNKVFTSSVRNNLKIWTRNIEHYSPVRRSIKISVHLKQIKSTSSLLEIICTNNCVRFFSSSCCRGCWTIAARPWRWSVPRARGSQPPRTLRTERKSRASSRAWQRDGATCSTKPVAGQRSSLLEKGDELSLWDLITEQKLWDLSHCRFVVRGSNWWCSSTAYYLVVISCFLVSSLRGSVKLHCT